MPPAKPSIPAVDRGCLISGLDPRIGRSEEGWLANRPPNDTIIEFCGGASAEITMEQLMASLHFLVRLGLRGNDRGVPEHHGIIPKP